MSTKNIANFIKKIHEKPFLSGAKLRKVGDSFLVESNWVYTDVEKAEKSYFQRSWLCSGAKADTPLSLPSKSFVPRENLKTRSPPRPDGKWVEVVEIKVGEGKELVMDLWDEQDGRLNRVNINKQVAKVNSESHITGLPKLSPDAKFCIFAAELKKEKKSFYDQLTVKEDKDEKDSESKIEYGTKNYSERSWGEQIIDVVSPKLVKVCFETGEVQVQTFDDFSCGDVQISSNGKIVFCALSEKPFKLGRIFCTNRPMAIYEVNHSDLNNPNRLTDLEYSYRLPRFIPNTNKLILLKRRPYGPHMDCDQLISFDLETNTERMIIDKVTEYPKTEDEFPGLFTVNFKPDPFLSIGDKSDYLVFETYWKNRTALSICDLSNGKIERIDISKEHSLDLLDLTDNAILATQSNENEHSEIKLLTFKNQIQYEEKLCFSAIKRNSHKVEVLELVADDNTPFQAKLQSKEGNKKLVLYPHGGPHSNSFRFFSKLSHIFVENGFDFLSVNYRGSIGYGSDFVTKLPGKCGDVDVSDCLKAFDTVQSKKSYDENFVFGFSHGGWLTAHLTAARPDGFKAACLGNPVINLVTCYPLSDIPEWSYYEAFGHYQAFDFGKPLSMDEMKSAFESSPISKVDAVKCPSLMIIGQKDLRVPPNQGIEWIRALDRNDVKTRTIEYPKDNHSLSTLETELEFIIQIYQWFTMED